MKSLLRALALLAILFSTQLSGLAAEAPATPQRKVLLVVASRNYLESEYENTRQALESASIAVEVASDSADEATGYGAGRIRPDLLIDRARPADYDAIVVIGGYGAREHLWNHLALQALLRDAHAQGRYVAALCAAPPVLANAGLLKGLNATMWPDKSWIAVLESGGAHYVDQPVVVEGRIVTGKNPAAARAFGETLASLVKAARQAAA